MEAGFRLLQTGLFFSRFRITRGSFYTPWMGEALHGGFKVDTGWDGSGPMFVPAYGTFHTTIKSDQDTFKVTASKTRPNTNMVIETTRGA